MQDPDKIVVDHFLKNIFTKFVLGEYISIFISALLICRRSCAIELHTTTDIDNIVTRFSSI